MHWLLKQRALKFERVVYWNYRPKNEEYWHTNIFFTDLREFCSSMLCEKKNGKTFLFFSFFWGGPKIGVTAQSNRTELQIHAEQNMRVPSRFFGIRDLAYSKAGIRDFGKKRGARFGIVILIGTRDLAIFGSVIREVYEENQAVILSGCRKLAKKMYPRPNHAAIATPMAIFCLFS